MLIYHDEIKVDPELPDGETYAIGDIAAPGALVCTSETVIRAAWRMANHEYFPDISNHTIFSMDLLNQIRTNLTERPSRARLSRGGEAVNPVASNQSGLWACRVNWTNPHIYTCPDLSNIIFVGIYRRGQGEQG